MDLLSCCLNTEENAPPSCSGHKPKVVTMILSFLYSLHLMHQQLLSILPPNVFNQMCQQGGKESEWRPHIYKRLPKCLNKKRAANKKIGWEESIVNEHRRLGFQMFCHHESVFCNYGPI